MFDVETTGLEVRTARILSLGFRLHVDGNWQNFIIFTERCSHRSIRPVTTPWDAIHQALQPLRRPSMILVGHNITFDLLMLQREWVVYRGETRDTLAMLRLDDQDRTFSAETVGRRYLRAPQGLEWSSYKLKTVAYHLLGIAPKFTPSPNMDLVPYAEHAIYLAHDLYTTHKIHDYLWQGLSASLRRHYVKVQSPLTSLLCDLRWVGTAGDREFIRTECDRLDELMSAISERHQVNHGFGLLDKKDEDIRKLLFYTYKLPHRRHSRKKSSISSEAIANLLNRTANPVIQASLLLIAAFREAHSLRLRLGGYLKNLHADNRFHSQFDNRQASGRISSSAPNLQQIAKRKTIFKGDSLEAVFSSRNLVIPSLGCVLIAADVAQADVRVLGHEIDRTTETTQQHFRRLQSERFQRLPRAARLWKAKDNFLNMNWCGTAAPPLVEFDPNALSPLVQNFLNTEGDFYSVVASQVTGRTITKSDPERSVWKTILLAQINSETPTGLAVRLKCTKDEARSLVDKFFAAYPDIASWVALQQQQIALTGETYTWGGRRRRNTPHYWMVSQKRIRLLLTYKNGPRRWRYWFDVTPIRPTQRYLTCFIYRVWNISDENGDKPAKLIYDQNRGRLGTKPYRHLDETERFLLPYRNIPWSNIRRVQRLDRQHQPIEMARYEGFDTTCRSLVNSIMQGGTVDMVTQMMLRCRSICLQFEARLLINIHDELVYEVPQAHLLGFITAMQQSLAVPLGPEWRIPLVMEFKMGPSFGQLQEIP